MPIDPVTTTSPTVAPAKSLPTKSLNEADFGALVTQDLKAGLRPGPKMTPPAGDGFKSTAKPERFMPLKPGAFTGTAPLSAKSVEALGATTKHPLGPQKR